MSKTKIASVSYLNSVTFNYGITHSSLIDAELSIAPPKECAEMLRSGEVDVALIPVGALPSFGNDIKIITSYCIGTQGAVRSVVLLSDEPLESIRKIWLDEESTTSVWMMKYLADNYLNISPEWSKMDSTKQVDSPKDGDAFLLIGDKAFDYEGMFEYTLDLGEVWLKATKLPMAFAVWCTMKELTPEVLEGLEEALTWGDERPYEALLELRKDVDIEESYSYLSENLDFILDNPKRESIKRLLSSPSEIVLTR